MLKRKLSKLTIDVNVTLKIVKSCGFIYQIKNLNFSGFGWKIALFISKEYLLQINMTRIRTHENNEMIQNVKINVNDHYYNNDNSC